MIEPKILNKYVSTYVVLAPPKRKASIVGAFFCNLGKKYQMSDFQGNAAAIEASRQTQLCIGIPFIVLGALIDRSVFGIIIFACKTRRYRLEWWRDYRGRDPGAPSCC